MPARDMLHIYNKTSIAATKSHVLVENPRPIPHSDAQGVTVYLVYDAKIGTPRVILLPRSSRTPTEDWLAGSPHEEPLHERDYQACCSCGEPGYPSYSRDHSIALPGIDTTSVVRQHLPNGGVALSIQDCVGRFTSPRLLLHSPSTLTFSAANHGRSQRRTDPSRSQRRCHHHRAIGD